jgi:hypothetical protein
MKSFVAPNVTPVARNGPKSDRISVNQTDAKQSPTAGEIDFQKRWRLSVAPMMDCAD